MWVCSLENLDLIEGHQQLKVSITQSEKKALDIDFVRCFLVDVVALWAAPAGREMTVCCAMTHHECGYETRSNCAIFSMNLIIALSIPGIFVSRLHSQIASGLATLYMDWLRFMETKY